jgi:hypothetical protein
VDVIATGAVVICSTLLSGAVAISFVRRSIASLFHVAKGAPL